MSASPSLARAGSSAVGRLRTRRRTSEGVRWALLYTAAVVAAALFMGPFLFAVSTSLKDPSEIFRFPPDWLPRAPKWGTYVGVWTMVPFAQWVVNTAIVTALAMAGQIASATLVAYGFARFRFPLQHGLFMVLLATMIIPVEVTIIPQFLLFKAVGWIDSWLPLIVPNYFGGGAFTIFLLRQFFLTLPRELDEAAEIDGAGTLRVLWSILLPLSRPALATVAIFAFIFHWNDFFFPLVYINSSSKFTLSLGLRYFQNLPTAGGSVLIHFLMAASLIVTVPIVVLFFSLQRYFIRGIVMSGLKG